MDHMDDLGDDAGDGGGGAAIVRGGDELDNNDGVLEEDELGSQEELITKSTIIAMQKLKKQGERASARRKAEHFSTGPTSQLKDSRLKAWFFECWAHYFRNETVLY
jgi:hypothetical protein